MPPSRSTFKRLSGQKLAPPLRCTHMRFTRLYDHARLLRCAVCHRIPDLGHLYRCTEDTAGNIPDVDLVDEDLASSLTDYKINDQASDSLNASQAAPGTASLLPVINPSSAQVTISSEGTVDTDPATDELPASELAGKRKFEAAFPPKPPHVLAGTCNLKICHACRPVFRDRTWESIDHIVNDPIISPSQHELDNRRISNAVIMGNMKFNGLNRGHDEGHDTDESMPHFKATSQILSPANITNADPVNELFESESDTGDVKEDAASDADDEKGFGRDDTSDSSSSEGDEDDRHSVWQEQPALAAKENRRSFDHDVVSTCHMPLCAGNIDPNHLSGHPATDSQDDAEVQNEGPIEENEQKRRGRALSKGRFFID